MSETETQVHQPRRISTEDRKHFDREGFSGDVYIDPDEKLGFSALMVDVHGSHPLKKMMGGATRSYLVIEGAGTFTLNGITTEVKKDDLIVIPNGGTYKYQGEMKLFEFNVPGTTSDNSITLEEE